MRVAVVPLVVLALALLAASGGCARRGPADPDAPRPGDPIPPSFDPIAIPNPGRAGEPTGSVQDERPVGEEDAGWEAKLELAQGYANGGYDEAALEVIRQALALAPPEPWAQAFREVRTSLRVRRLETTVLRAEVRGVKDYVPFGTDVDWVVRVRNVSPAEVVLAPGEGASPSALVLAITRRDIDIYAAELRRSWTRTVFLQAPGGPPIRIPPGGSYDGTVRIPAEDVGGPLSGLRVLEIAGTLRAATALEGGGGEGLRLPLRPGRVVVLPAGFEPLARDPLASMAQAVDAVAPPHLLVASEFVTVQDVGAGLGTLARALAEGDAALRTAALGAVGILAGRAAGRPVAPLAEPFVRALDTVPERADALIDALHRLSGVALPPDPRLWAEWWRRAAADGSRVPGSREEGGA